MMGGRDKANIPGMVRYNYAYPLVKSCSAIGESFRYSPVGNDQQLRLN